MRVSDSLLLGSRSYASHCFEYPTPFRLLFVDRNTSAANCRSTTNYRKLASSFLTFSFHYFANGSGLGWSQFFTIYLSRSISKHLKSNIGSEPKPDSHARKNYLVGQPPGLFPFLQPEYFLTLAKFLPPSKAKLKAKLLPLSKQNFLFPLSPSAFLQSPSSPCCTSRSFPEKKLLTQRKCKADGFSTYVQGGRRERMKF